MDIQIEIIGDVKVNNMGKYSMIELAYKDLKDGKVNGRKVPDFTISEGKSVLTGAKSGDKLTISMQKEAGKDGKEYWQWKKIVAGGSSSAPSAASGNTSPRSTYETPEERKQRQDYIIRQSSLSSAISLLKTEKNIPNTEEVLALAEQFVSFVYAKPKETNPFEDMPDDIPM